MDNFILEKVGCFLDNHLNIRSDDLVVILYEVNCREICAFVSVACASRGVSCTEIPMRPLRDEHFEARLLKGLSDFVGDGLRRLFLITLELHTLSHSAGIYRVLGTLGLESTICVRMMSATPDLFRYAIQTFPKELSYRNSWLLKKLVAAGEMELRSPAGTHMKVVLDSSRYRWISSRGAASKGGDMIFPAGEIATFPDSIEGIFIADFALHANQLIDFDVTLERCPVRLKIAEGKVIDINCKNKIILSFVEGAFSDNPLANKVGELGFGTNPGVTTPTKYNSHINERVVGFHLGLGQHNQSGLLDYDCRTHIDFIAKGGDVMITSSQESFSMMDIPSIPLTHPFGVVDQDVFSCDDDSSSSSCCGMPSQI
jgi:hypothetical protein